MNSTATRLQWEGIPDETSLLIPRTQAVSDDSPEQQNKLASHSVYLSCHHLFNLTRGKYHSITKFQRCTSMLNCTDIPVQYESGLRNFDDKGCNWEVREQGVKCGRSLDQFIGSVFMSFPCSWFFLELQCTK